VRSCSEVAAYLEAEVLSGQLRAGAKLPSERQLAARLGVSRPLVREALRTLVERGLVETTPSRGTFVRGDLSPGQAPAILPSGSRNEITPGHIMELRGLVEPTAARLAAERATDAEIDTLGRVVDNLEAAHTVLDRARWDIAFHALVARMSHNPLVERTFDSITPLVFELALRSNSNARVMAAALPFHRLVFNAIRDGDADCAYAAMVEHDERGARFYGRDWNTSIDVIARRELGRLLGPSTSVEQVIGELLRDAESGTKASRQHEGGTTPKTRRRAVKSKA
jgi:GntR family transcriptional repressor for pyruvate dehydrogenase complex